MLKKQKENVRSGTKKMDERLSRSREIGHTSDLDKVCGFFLPFIVTCGSFIIKVFLLCTIDFEQVISLK